MPKFKAKILLVEDDKDVLNCMIDLLQRDNYSVSPCRNGEEALDLYRKHVFDVVLTDIQMPVMDGLKLMKHILEDDRNAVVILITGYANVRDAVAAIKSGAEDYITKPANPVEIRKTIERVLEKRKLSIENQRLKTLLNHQGQSEIVGQSNKIIEAKKMAEHVAESDIPVLITGESGTGKEVFARAIHEYGKREGLFVPINCGAISESLLESELYGHEKGAFTGAENIKYGLFEAADGGTVLLDEIAEMPMQLQVKLLRTIETKTIRRVGGIKAIEVDFRIISSTNRDIELDIKKGMFREDLYYRLNGFPIQLPALKDRVEDIILLINYFFSEWQVNSQRMSKSVISALEHYSWPGNIRELKHILKRLLVMSAGENFQVEHLPIEIQQLKPNARYISRSSEDIWQPLYEVEKEHILKVFNACENSKVEAAKILGIGLKTLYRKLDAFALEEE
ncbi:sigma-54-dependent Fis family transcriptional regulator [bacterium]|nr:sigma-54-dependent Fis family transcriptional regulator [bacterium]